MAKFNLEYIKNRRMELGLSTAAVAEKLGFKNPSVYWKYENGQYKFRAEIIPALADILQCKPENFFDNLSAETEREAAQ